MRVSHGITYSHGTGNKSFSEDDLVYHSALKYLLNENDPKSCWKFDLTLANFLIPNNGTK